MCIWSNRSISLSWCLPRMSRTIWPRLSKRNRCRPWGQVRVRELIYVDDGSVDGSHVVLRDLQTRFTRLKVLCHVRAVGQNMAVLSGVRHGRGDWLVVLDGDGQNDPADIPAMLEAMRRYQSDPYQVGLIGHRVSRRDDWVKRSLFNAGQRFSRPCCCATAFGYRLRAQGRASRLVSETLPAFNHIPLHPRADPGLRGRMAPGRSTTGHARRASQTRGLGTGSGSGWWTWSGVWWLQRRSKVVEIREMLE